VVIMPLDYSISLDLISKNNIDEEKLISVKKLVSLKPIPTELKESLVEILENQKGKKLEIYIEDLEISEDAEDDLQDFIAELDEEIIQLADESLFIWASSYPACLKIFKKNGFTWDYTEESDEEYDLDLPIWEDYE